MFTQSTQTGDPTDTVTKVETAINQVVGLAGLVAPEFAPEIAIASALIDGVEKIVIPLIRKIGASGTVTPEAQQALKDRIDSIRAALANDTLFSGPEWQVRPDPAPAAAAHVIAKEMMDLPV